MARERKGLCKIYTPAELGLDIADTSGTPTINGAYVDIADFDQFLLWIVFSNSNVAGHVRFGAKLADGSTDSPFTPLRGASAFPFVFGGQVVVSCDVSNGVFMGVDATSPTFAATFAALDQVRFQVQITTGGAGTASAHLYCKRRTVATLR